MCLVGSIEEYGHFLSRDATEGTHLSPNNHYVPVNLREGLPWELLPLNKSLRGAGGSPFFLHMES